MRTGTIWTSGTVHRFAAETWERSLQSTGLMTRIPGPAFDDTSVGVGRRIIVDRALLCDCLRSAWFCVQLDSMATVYNSATK